MPAEHRFLMIPFFQVVSYAFLRSKKTAMVCCFLMKDCLISVSMRVNTSVVDLQCLNPYCKGVITFLDSRVQTRRVFTIRSISLQRQLVSDIGLWFVIISGSFLGFRKGKIIALVHAVGKSRDVHIMFVIARKNFMILFGR